MPPTLTELETYAQDIYLQFMSGLAPMERAFVLATVERLNVLEES